MREFLSETIVRTAVQNIQYIVRVLLNPPFSPGFGAGIINKTAVRSLSQSTLD